MSQKRVLSRRTLIQAAAGAVMVGAGAVTEAADDRPVVWYAKTVTKEALIALYEKVSPALSGRIGIKIHGGEAAVNYPLFSALQQHIANSNFVETNWASDFGGERRHTASHLAEIRRQGVEAPVDILDRDETPADYVTLPVEGGNELTTVEVPRALVRDYGGIVVLTNFKMPSFAGFTGAVKNIGIGLVSPDAKAAVHGAGYERSRGFFRRMADAAKGVKAALGDKLVGISILTDIKAQENCGVKPASGTLGILASTDPTALDQAACDLIWSLSEKASRALTEKVKIDSGYMTLEALEACRSGSRRYRLETLA